MDHEHIFYTIEDNANSTKASVEGLVALLSKGYQVADTYSYKKETYYVLIKHIHEHEEASSAN